MNPTVEALLVLQDRDTRVAHLTSDLAHLPQQIAQVEADLATRTATFDELKSRTRQIEADRKKLDLDVQSMLGLSISRIGEFADSGYVYLIYSSTIFGLIVFWLFVCLYPAGTTPAQRRCAHSLSLFIFLNMMIGGTAIFSIKIAGLLWLLVGYMRVSENPRAIRIRPESLNGSRVPG